MPASVSLSSLSWSAPDGTPLFTDLDLTFGAERTGLVGRNGTGKSTLLQLIAGHSSPASGRISVTGLVAMMRQEALAHPEETVADILGVRPALELMDRAERGRATSEELAEADWTLHARIEAALARCDLSVDPDTRLACLSGGQRSRAALAALILAEPDFLLMDEPTNNLDRAGRRAVIDLLRGWSGGAIVASHDRELLDEMDAIVELTSLGAAKYRGNYSAFRQQRESARAAAAQDLAHAQKLRAEAVHRAQQAEAAELAELCRENRRLREEVEVMRKGARANAMRSSEPVNAFFAQWAAKH
ncbi:ABC-F family ATP-binding cassette domain-containing protein [Rhodovulum sulfidophilum]|uniref:ATP-binding cassette domain-containing protein n=1 Tax=Rhodovulum sulfidophilum TaxID=35806 RepID=UPI0019277C6C|nr:ATP-binding cassette domain-containing protein [Rhodovulum sulfidophilum]MBL3587692.1 ABC-F family ATP-binding cassette domain-containing protein [Rhodovulum sulfidophilum]